VTTNDAIDMAIEALRRDAETFSLACRMVEMLGADSPPDARKDAARYTRRIEAVQVLEKHKRETAKPVTII